MEYNLHKETIMKRYTKLAGLAALLCLLLLITLVACDTGNTPV